MYRMQLWVIWASIMYIRLKSSRNGKRGSRRIVYMKARWMIVIVGWNRERPGVMMVK
jgi:hypothetical protein